jgi:hypothetical protein
MPAAVKLLKLKTKPYLPHIFAMQEAVSAALSGYRGAASADGGAGSWVL